MKFSKSIFYDSSVLDVKSVHKEDVILTPDVVSAGRMCARQLAGMKSGVTFVAELYTIIYINRPWHQNSCYSDALMITGSV